MFLRHAVRRQPSPNSISHVRKRIIDSLTPYPMVAIRPTNRKGIVDPGASQANQGAFQGGMALPVLR